MADASFDYSSLAQKLEQIQANIPNALEAAGVSLLNAAARNITDGGPFAPWSAAYRRRTHQHGILWDTGTLLRSLMPGGPEDIIQSTGENSIKVGSNVIYAAYLNFGRNTNPARPYLYVDSQRAADAKEAFLAQLFKGIN